MEAQRKTRRRSLRYRVVDVLTQNPLEGIPLAVFRDASGLDDAAMQRIARELNLSETTFLACTLGSDQEKLVGARFAQANTLCQQTQNREPRP